MTSTAGFRAALLLACVFASAAGCAGAPKDDAKDAALTTTEKAASANTDPCAMRLHDVCGPLLLYYATNRALPAKLEQLSEVSGFESVKNFTCPASGKPYVYNPAGSEPGGAGGGRRRLPSSSAPPRGVFGRISMSRLGGSGTSPRTAARGGRSPSRSRRARGHWSPKSSPCPNRAFPTEARPA